MKPFAAKVVQGHKKQSGGRGQFGDCWINEMEAPAARFRLHVFEDAIVSGAIRATGIPPSTRAFHGQRAARGSSPAARSWTSGPPL